MRRTGTGLSGRQNPGRKIQSIPRVGPTQGGDLRFRAEQSRNWVNWVDFLPHLRSQNSNSSTRGKGRIGGSLTRLLSSSGGAKRGKIIVVFPRLTSIRRVCFRPVNGTFLQILGVPTGEKTRRNQANIPKRRLSRLGYDPFFLRKFRFLCPFGVKKAAIPRPGRLHQGCTRGGL